MEKKLSNRNPSSFCKTSTLQRWLVQQQDERKISVGAIVSKTQPKPTISQTRIPKQCETASKEIVPLRVNGTEAGEASGDF